jgi:hypothetical protein
MSPFSRFAGHNFYFFDFQLKDVTEESNEADARYGNQDSVSDRFGPKKGVCFDFDFSILKKWFFFTDIVFSDFCRAVKLFFEARPMFQRR